MNETTVIEFARLLFSDTDFTILWLACLILAVAKEFYRAAKSQWRQTMHERNELERKYDMYR